MRNLKWIVLLFMTITLSVSCGEKDLKQEAEKGEIITEENENKEPEEGQESKDSEEEQGSKDPEQGTNPQGKGVIRGTVSVYNDSKELGILNKGTVKLFKNKKVVKTTTVNKVGAYTFSDVEEGEYRIQAFQDGYYNEAIQKMYPNHYARFSVSKDSNVVADIKIHKKSTAEIESVSWRQGSKSNGDPDNGVLLSVTFKELNISEADRYVYIYFMAGYDDQIDKFNCVEKLDQKGGNGWTPGYIMAAIPIKAIVNNKLVDYWNSSFCWWMGSSLKSAAKSPSYIAIYTCNAFGLADDALFGVLHLEFGDEFSGISNNRFLKKVR